jgi:hypothetical protein
LTGGCFEEVVQTGKGPVKNREQLSLDGTMMMENVRSGGRSCGSEKEESCVPSSGALRELNLDSALDESFWQLSYGADCVNRRPRFLALQLRRLNLVA